MSSKYKFHNPDGLYFITSTVYNWVDVFTRIEYREIILDSLRHCQQKKGLTINAWCLMTNHLHMIASTADEPLQGIMRDFKRHTSTVMRAAINDNPQESRKAWMLWMMEKAGSHNPNNHDWQFWEQDNHPQEIHDVEMLSQKLDYIHDNPVKAGFVAEPQDYLYSSARDYAGMKGLLDIEVLSMVGM